MLRSRIPILISLDHIRPKDPRLSLGVASIISHLSHNKIEYNAHSYNIAQEVQVYPLARNILDTIWSQYNDSKYDLMFGGFVWNEPFLKTILRELKYYDYPGRIVIAGPQVSYVEKGELEKYYPEGDVFIRGYAEQAVLELAEGKDNILGVHLANTPDKGFHTSTKLSDLSSPFLDGTLEPQHFMRWETTRGCPYSCSFCQHRDPSPSSPANKSWTKIQHSQRDRIQSEIEWFVDNNVHDLAVLDPTFNTLNGKMVLDFLERARFSGKISLQCRPERITEAFLDQVESLSKTTGAEVVLEFGVQTLDPEELLHIERVRNANTYKLAEKVLHKLALVNQRRIKHEVSLIFIWLAPANRREFPADYTEASRDDRWLAGRFSSDVVTRNTLILPKEKIWADRRYGYRTSSDRSDPKIHSSCCNLSFYELHRLEYDGEYCCFSTRPNRAKRGEWNTCMT